MQRWFRFSGAAVAVVATAFALHGSIGRTSAQRPQPSKPAAKPLQPGEIDVEKSRVYVFVGKTGFGHEHGVEGRLKSGMIRLDQAGKVGTVVFDMTTFVADTPEARRYVGLGGSTSQSTRDAVTRNMLGEHVLDVARFPTATFEITDAELLKQKSTNGHPQYKLTGRLTLHGVTRPLAVEAEAIEKGDRLWLRTAFYLYQTHFGMTPYKTAFGTVGVADRLTVYGEVYLARGSVSQATRPGR